MAAKKKVTKKKTTTKSTWKYAAVNYDNEVYFSDGPLQVLEGECIMWPTNVPNNWSTSTRNAKYKINCVGGLPDGLDCDTEAFVCSYGDFVKQFPTFGTKDTPNRKVSPNKQIKFCV